MYNCIFTSHCLESFCDGSCPVLAQTSYLLERNGITMKNPVFSSSEQDINKMRSVLDTSKESTYGLVVDSNVTDTIKIADLLTYVAICENWKGSNLHCTVYNLKYSIYLDEMKKSWSLKSEPESLEYMRIWAQTAKILIVSNFDYVDFKEFESQTLLNLIQTRSSQGLTTILVSPEPRKLMSTKFNNPFFSALKSNWLLKSEGAHVIHLSDAQLGGRR